MKNFRIINIGKIIGITEPHETYKKGKDMLKINEIDQAYIIINDGKIKEFGEMKNCFLEQNIETIDAKGKWLMTGFVDSHTHCVFAKSRHQEYVMRLQGKTYEEIAQAGGGILNSAKHIEAVSEEFLIEKTLKHLDEIKKHGTTSIEIKSGYGLSTQSEIKMLRVIKKLKEISNLDIYSTFLGAHAIPKEYKENREEYIKLIINDMLPQIAEQNLADFIDVFCDKGFFTVEETEKIILEGEKFGLKAKIHGNELGLTGGVQVAVKHGALSVDHLEHVSNEEINCLLNSDTMPVVLPGSSFFLKIPYSPARAMIDAGLPIAIASDFNPGSSPHYNLWFTWSLACLYNGMLPSEAFNALTINAAKSIGKSNEVGSIQVGKKAHLQLVKPMQHINEFPYWLTQNHTERVFV